MSSSRTAWLNFFRFRLNSRAECNIEVNLAVNRTMRSAQYCAFGIFTWFFVTTVQHVHAQSVEGLHRIQFESAGGLTWNPVQSLHPLVSGHARSSISGWGTQDWGANTMTWQAKSDVIGFAGTDFESRKTTHLIWSLERALNANVSTGIRAGGFNGDVLERNLRNAEEWSLFDATQWNARWWLTLNNGLRHGQLYAHREEWNYRTLGGLDRREFAFGSSLNLPILTRVRGKRGLLKVNQQRTHHLANLVVCFEHRETQFDGWALGEGPVAGGDWLRSDAVSAFNSTLDGLSLWTETKGELRLELEEVSGIGGGLSSGWVYRRDEVRRAYDALTFRSAGWISGASAQWAGRLMWQRDAVAHPELTVVNESGWEAYRYAHSEVQFRLERGVKNGWGVFTEGQAQFWRSNATDQGWYQRGDWSAWSLRIGWIWQRSNEARWVQHHAPVRRMAP